MDGRRPLSEAHECDHPGLSRRARTELLHALLPKVSVGMTLHVAKGQEEEALELLTLFRQDLADAGLHPCYATDMIVGALAGLIVDILGPHAEQRLQACADSLAAGE